MTLACLSQGNSDQGLLCSTPSIEFNQIQQTRPVVLHQEYLKRVSMEPTEIGEASAGDFIFINHNAKRLRTIKDRSHRAAVNQHVQKVWLKNQKPKGEKAFERASQNDRIPSPLDRTYKSEADPSHGAYPTPPPQAPPYKTSQLVKFRATLKKHARNRKDDAPSKAPFAAFNILTHGNSDPFNTLAIPFDATVSHLLQYSKEVMIPSVYSMEVRSTTPSLGIVKAWELVTLAFEDECAISAYLAISATSLMRVSPSSDLVRIALKYNNRSSALLRQRIATNTIDPQLYIIVLWLSANALATRDFTAGMVHANTLCYLVRQGGGIGSVEPFQRENILHFDVQFAMMFLRRTFFDVKDYSPGAFETSWLNDADAVAEPSATHKLHSYPPLTPSLTSPDLVATITSLRELHAIYAFTLSHGVPGTSPILRWMYMQKHAVEAELLDFCCNLIYSPIISASTPPHSELEAEYNSLLPLFCIAALYWTAMAVGHSRQKIHACSMLLIHLRSLLSATPAHDFTAVNQTCNNPNAVLRLWVLYVGCLAEQAIGLEQAPGEWENWCTRRFVLQLRWMGITGHEQCRAVLEGVLFSESMHRENAGEGRTALGREDVLVETITEVKEERGWSKKWRNTEEKEVGFKRWWDGVQRRFGGDVVGDLGS